MDAPWSLQVFFDGACPLCSREIRHYKKRDRFNKIQWVDIAQAAFNAAAFDLNPARVQQAMHARAPDGTVFVGVDAFVRIWRTPPWSIGTAALRAILKVPGMMWVARHYYRWFAKNRYRLTGRCTPDSCAVPPGK